MKKQLIKAGKIVAKSVYILILVVTLPLLSWSTLFVAIPMVNHPDYVGEFLNWRLDDKSYEEVVKFADRKGWIIENPGIIYDEDGYGSESIIVGNAYTPFHTHIDIRVKFREDLGAYNVKVNYCVDAF